MSRKAPCRPLLRRLPCSAALAQLPPLPVPAYCWSRLPEELAGWRANNAQVLVKTEAPITLYKHLTRYWAVPDTPLEDPGGRATRSNAYPATGAVAAVGLPVLETLRNLVFRKVDEVNKLSPTLLTARKESLLTSSTLRRTRFRRVSRTGSPTAATAPVAGSALERVAGRLGLPRGYQGPPNTSSGACRGQVVGELQPQSPHEGEVGCEEERIEADDHGEAGSRDLAADSVEVSHREVARALPHAEEGM